MLWRLTRPALLALTALILSVAPVLALPVVPGAFGFGMDTRAAYACGANPTVIKVTSLADTNTSGTLRYAMLQSYPRIIVFETSGYIDLTSSFDVVNPCMTIAGQTAPSPGITVRAAASYAADKLVVINTHDVLIQHLRWRPGSGSCNSGPLIVYSYLDTGDGQGVVAHALFYNVVFDHVSVSWGQDEGLYAGATDINGGNSNVTFWRTIAAEGLWAAPGSEACGGGGLANGHGIFSEGQQVDIMQSLMSLNRERNPMLDGGFSTRLLNNIIYGWQGEWGVFTFNKSAHPGAWFLTAIGNRFIAGPQTGSNTNVGGAVEFWWGTASPDNSAENAGNKAYLLDNTVSNGVGATIFPTNLGHGFGQQSYDPAVGVVPSQAPIPTGYSAVASSALEAYLLPLVGARPADRDAVDTRIIANVVNRAGQFISQPSDVGGYPTLATNTATFTAVLNPHADAGDGYTNLEHQLQAAAAIVENAAVIPPDVTAASGANIVTAHFTGSNGTLLTNYTSDTGGGWTLQSGSVGILELDASNRLLSISSAATSATISNATPLSAEYDVAADLITTANLTTGTEYALWARALTANPTGYFFSIDVAGGMAYLRRTVNSSYQTLGSCAHTFAPSSTTHIILRVRNAGQHAIIGGVQCTATTDNTIAAAGKAGVSVYAPTAADDATHGARFDDFTVTDTLVGSSPTITTASVPNGVLTHIYTATLAATAGSGGYTWTVSAGALPNGLSLGSTTGAITGTPTVAGTFTFTVRVTDGLSATGIKAFSIIANPAVSITTISPLPVATRLSGYSTFLVAAGDQAPDLWVITAGSLPTGLSLNASTGAITGTPLTTTSSTFTMSVTGALGSIITKSMTLQVAVEYRPPTRPIARNSAEGVVYRRATPPTNPADAAMTGDLWVDTSTNPPTVKVCTAATSSGATWVTVP